MRSIQPVAATSVLQTIAVTTAPVIGLLLIAAATGACSGASNTSRSLSGATILLSPPRSGGEMTRRCSTPQFLSVVVATLSAPPRCSVFERP